MIYRLLTACAAMVFLIASCSKLPGYKNPQPNDDILWCGTTGADTLNDSSCILALCATVFMEIPLEVVDGNGKLIKLDAFYTEDMMGNILSPDLYSYNSTTGSYVVFNDSWMKNNRNSKVRVRFIGELNGQVVVNEVYTIISDCCHVYKDSGKDKVILP